MQAFAICKAQLLLGKLLLLSSDSGSALVSLLNGVTHVEDTRMAVTGNTGWPTTHFITFHDSFIAFHQQLIHIKITSLTNQLACLCMDGLPFVLYSQCIAGVQ